MPRSLLPSNKPQTVTGNSIEISVKGKWSRVPALEVAGKFIIVRGRWLKLALIEAEEWLATELEEPELCIKELNEQGSHGLHADIFTFTQKLPSTTPKYKYPMDWDSVAAVCTTSFAEWWEKLPQETRKNVRRSQKRGVVVEVKELDDDAIRALMELNNDSPVRQGKTYRHYGKSFDQVKKDQESFPDRRDLVFAYSGSELIGFMKIVYRGGVAAILQLLPKASHFDKRPANILIAEAIKLCEAKRISYLTFGLFNYGNKRGDSLREFKIRNGFEEVLMPRYYVPLTLKGKFSMNLNLHRGLIGILPHSLITLGVRVREKWYNLTRSRSGSISRCSSMVEQSNRIRQTGRSNPPAGSNT